ncbi:hypothetical protein PY650_04665 [Rhizobium calliandrae]|uniref:Uncharacterized protein n=1 Tax=Rhizobium calliandrae TaxID=1312182 RepID=A0ABT7K8P7_9HYPH|nr:hypothetical protein [Rhizobium calliandrae]MDL2404962.1 hypothetical protein [Rhizobium calliandrae]
MAHLILVVLGWLTAVIGFVMLIALGIWWIVDAFLSKMIADHDEELRRR